jgi:hypothetical protein
MPSQAPDSFKSKLIERLREISRGAPSPIGFGRAPTMHPPALLMLAVLPRNETALAEAAVRAGADAIALRLHGAATEFLSQTGDLAAESTAIKDTVAALAGKAVVGLVIGSNGTMSPDCLPQLADLGVDFVAAYPHLTPAGFLELAHAGRLAILDHQGGATARGVNDLPIQAVLVRIERPADSPVTMTVLDAMSYRSAADGIHRPIIAFPSWKLVPGDLEPLKNAGIEGVALVGPQPDASAEAVEAAIRPYDELVTRLGKPNGRRVALTEPAVVLPRVAVPSEANGDEPDEDDDDARLGPG